MVWWWLIGLLFLGGALALRVLLDWMTSKKVAVSDYGELIKSKLRNGNYKVVAGVFSSSGVLRDKQMYETEELDDDLKRQFGYRDKVRVQI